MRHAAIAMLAALLLCAPAASTAQTGSDVDVSIFAVNDVHGNLLPPNGGIAIADPAGGRTVAVAAGGMEFMASLIKQLRAQTPNSIFVAAGDLIGASPLLSNLFHDEPIIESLSLMGLEVSAVGNHEFDKGLAELRRMQDGGCHPVDGCRGPHPFGGAKFRYLAASTFDKATGKTIFPAYYVKRFQGVPVAFVGLTLKNTPALIATSSAQGLEFRDEAETVNALVPELRRQGIEAIIVLIHDGGIPAGNSADYNGCPGLRGDIVNIVPKLDKAVDVVVSGHSHSAYNCVIDGRLVTSAHRYGTLVTRIDLRLDARTHDVTTAKAENLIVRDGSLPKDAEQTALIAAYQERAAPVAGRVVGQVAEPLAVGRNPAGESPLGDFIADGELAATRDAANGGAVIGFVNMNGVRFGLGRGPDDPLTYADLFAVNPFSDLLVTLTLTGAEVKSVLEAQWTDSARPLMLQPSDGFSYTWDAARPFGDRVVPGSMTLRGTPIRPDADYRVVVQDFLADGGGGFAVFRGGRDRRPAMADIDATEAYVRAHTPLTPPPSGRISRLN
jgi:5'-nucleotidase